MTTADYQTGHIKRDPQTGTVAIRTGFTDEPPFADKAWLTATTRTGAHFATTATVAGWDDLYTPPPIDEQTS